MSTYDAELQITGDISDFEYEVLFKILSDTFRLTVQERLEIPVEEPHATFVNLTFCSSFSAKFFQDVKDRAWNDLCGVLKEIRRRRGSHGAAFRIHFSSGKAETTLLCTAHREIAFEAAIDSVRTLTFIAASIPPEQIGSNTTYVFSEGAMSWIPQR